MKDPSRRRFIEMSGAAAAAFGVPMPHPTAPGLEPAASTTVHLSGDGLNLDPSEAAAEIVRLCAVEKPVADQYGLTGCVEDVENYFAALLGKERALFMPTGTLANHLAVRALARDRRRVIVQETSHIYNDTGDCEPDPERPDADAAGTRTRRRSPGQTSSMRSRGRPPDGVPAPVGAILIESPVRASVG